MKQNRNRQLLKCRWKAIESDGESETKMGMMLYVYMLLMLAKLRLHVIFGGMKGSTYYLFEAKNIIHNRIKGKKARALFFFIFSPFWLLLLSMYKIQYNLWSNPYSASCCFESRFFLHICMLWRCCRNIICTPNQWQSFLVYFLLFVISDMSLTLSFYLSAACSSSSMHTDTDDLMGT